MFDSFNPAVATDWRAVCGRTACTVRWGVGGLIAPRLPNRGGRKDERSEASIARGLRGRLRGQSLTQRSKDAKRTGMGELLLPDRGAV